MAAYRDRCGFTLIELLVVVAIIAILAALIFPVFAQAREKGRQTVCLSNMRQVGTALHMYAQDYDETLPLPLQTEDVGRPDAPVDLISALEPYARNQNIFVCPSTVNPSSAVPASKFLDPTPLRATSYLGNSVVLGRTLAAVPNPAEIVYFQEDRYKWRISWLRPRLTNPKQGIYQAWHWNLEPADPQEHFSNLHFGGGNLVFVDGHARHKHHQRMRSSDFGLVPDDGPEADANKPYKAAF